MQNEKHSSGLGGSRSTCSQPNKVFDYQSPQYQESIDSGELLEYPGLEQESSIFDSELYKRIEEFLDNEGLYIVDMNEYGRGNIRQGRRLLLKLQEYEGIMEEEQDRGESFQADFGRSASCHSPQLINDSITSKLFQRRISHSQAPIKALFVPNQDSLLLKTKLSRGNSRIKSPIMECDRDTPLSNRTPQRRSLRGSQYGTPSSGKCMQQQIDSTKKLLKVRAVSKGSSPNLPECIKSIPALKGAKSVHGKMHGSFFKIQGEF